MIKASVELTTSSPLTSPQFIGQNAEVSMPTSADSTIKASVEFAASSPLTSPSLEAALGSIV